MQSRCGRYLMKKESDKTDKRSQTTSGGGENQSRGGQDESGRNGEVITKEIRRSGKSEFEVKEGRCKRKEKNEEGPLGICRSSAQ